MRQGVSAFLEIVAESSGGKSLAIPRSAIVKDGITHVFFRRDPKDANKAIRVEAHDQHVVFQYRPASWRVGLAVSLLSAGAIGGLAWAARRRDRLGE